MAEFSAAAKVEMEVTLYDFADDFLAKLEMGGAETMHQIALQGAQKARDKAPTGTKVDPRTPHLKDSISSSSTAKSAKWECTARHAMIIETGGGPSRISGQVSFFWDRYQRRWKPGPNIIDHPPTHAKPFLEPPLHEVMRDWHEIAKTYYPQ